MPLAARIAAAATARQAKRSERYEGDAEEQATLLGEHRAADLVDEEEEDVRVDTSSQVRMQVVDEWYGS